MRKKTNIEMCYHLFSVKWDTSEVLLQKYQLSRILTCWLFSYSVEFSIAMFQISALNSYYFVCYKKSKLEGLFFRLMYICFNSWHKIELSQIACLDDNQLMSFWIKNMFGLIKIHNKTRYIKNHFCINILKNCLFGNW